MRHTRHWLLAAALLLTALPSHSTGQPERRQQATGLDDLFPPDPEPGGAAAGQRAGCYRKGTSLRKCSRCCQRVVPGSSNCLRGCYYNLVPREQWPE